LEFHFFKEKRMVDFRKKLLGLSLVLGAFTGVSYGQQLLCPSATAPGYQVQPGLPANLLRFEGTTEQVSAVTVYCAAGGTVASGSVQATISAPGFSPVITSPVGDPLMVLQSTTGVFGAGNPPAPPPPTAAAPTLYIGSILGSQVTFPNVAFPTAGAYSITIYNIRVNASALSPLVPALQVTESVLLTQAGVGNFAPVSQLVGLLYQGFSKAAVGGVQNYLVCKGSPIGAVPAGTITVTGLFTAAFKSKTPLGIVPATGCGVPAAACSATNGEQGNSVSAGVGAAATVGQATHGTRFQIAFAGLVAGETLSVPTTVTGTNVSVTPSVAAPNFVLQLVTSATGPIALAGSGVLTTSAAGTATAIYEVTQTDNTIFEAFTVPVTDTTLPNFTTAAQSAFTATVTVAPQMAVNNLEDIPNFSAPGNTLNLSAFNLCQTTLLFPFVSTNGVETGIALSNTSLDPGLIGGIATGTASPGGQGACTLNFYGTNVAAPGTAVTVLGVAAPNPTGGATPYVQPAGTSNAFPIGSNGLVPTGFNGYLIAQCNYLYAHGFAYIAYQLGTGNGATMGYVANVLTVRPIGAALPTVLTETVTN
jgi:hypothetical protein